MAGYSGTPLVKKLGIREGHRVALVGAPRGFPRTLGRLPRGAAVKSSLRGGADVILFFAHRRSELTRRLPALVRALDPDGGLWISWPKQASGVATDLGGNEVRALGLATGLVDNKVCAVDETWSGLRFVHRLEHRPKASTRPRR